MPVDGGLTDDQIRAEISKGARFVHYAYCISILVMSNVRHPLFPQI
jgi:hypothetical protein